MKKNRTYFEIAATEPEKPFEVGQQVLAIRTAVGAEFTTVRDNETTLMLIECPLSNGVVLHVSRIGKYASAHKFRVLFTLDEAREMGITPPIPHLGVVVCMDSDFPAGVNIRFWGGSNKYYASDGSGAAFNLEDDYRHIPDETALLVWPEMIEARKALQEKLESKQ